MKNFSIAFRTFSLLLILSAAVPAQLSGWGANQRGQLGVGNLSLQPMPMTISGVPDATAISSSSDFTLFLKANGRIFSTGDNQRGQLGNGNVTSQAQLLPAQVQDLRDVTQVSAGSFHGAALKTDGTVWSWGWNHTGQIGNGTISTQLSCFCIPFPLKTAISDVVQVDAGGNFSIALKADGTVWAWGMNTSGQLGDNSTLRRLSPVQVGVGVAGFNNIIAVSAGEFHAMALKADGTVWIWGSNESGQVGNGTFIGNQLQPVQNTTLLGVTQISAGSSHNVVVKTDGTIWTWGLNTYAQAGNGDPTGTPILTFPQQNTTLMNQVEIEAFGLGTFTRSPIGSVWAWGRNREGESGTGTVASAKDCQCQSTPIQSAVGTGNAVIGSGFSSGFAGMPASSTPASASYSRQFGRNVSFVFPSVTSSGTTSYTSIDGVATGLNAPAGYSIQSNAPAYNIVSTAGLGKSYVCLNASGEYDPYQFALLKILHEEGPNLIDRTASSVYMKRQVCAEVNSLGRFVVAKGTTLTPDTVSVGGRIMDAAGQGLANAYVFMTDEQGNKRTTRTNGFGYYGFISVSALKTYIIAPTAKSHRITDKTITVIGNLSDMDFYAQQ